MVTDGQRPRVLLTGADGSVGSGFRDEYLERYRGDYALRLAVRDPAFADSRFDDIVVADLADPDSLAAACRGVDIIVHLAANADYRAEFDALVGPNIVGLYQLFEAACAQEVRRVVYASSIHAVMGNPVDYQPHVDEVPRADCLYGVTKIFGEALCRLYADRHGLSCIALRIGAYRSEEQCRDMRLDDNPQLLDIAITQRDMAQLIHRSILAPDDLRFAIFNGVSDNRFKRLDIENARTRIGYRPEDDAFAISDMVHLGPERKV